MSTSMTRAVDEALKLLDWPPVMICPVNLPKARATLAAHIAAQDLTVQHLEGSCDVLRERIAARDAEIARLREALAPFPTLLQEHNELDARRRPVPDSQPVFGINDALITIGMLRQARAALTEGMRKATWQIGPEPDCTECFLTMVAHPDFRKQVAELMRGMVPDEKRIPMCADRDALRAVGANRFRTETLARIAEWESAK